MSCRTQHHVLQFGYRVPTPKPVSKFKNKQMARLMQRNAKGLTRLEQIAVDAILNHEPLQNAIRARAIYRIMQFVKRRGGKPALARMRSNMNQLLRKRGYLKKGEEMMKQAWYDPTDWGSAITDAMSSGLGKFSEAVMSAVEDGIDFTKDLGKQIGRGAASAWDAAKDGVMTAINTVGDGFSSIPWDAIGDFFEGLDPSKIMQEILDAFTSAAKSVADGIKGVGLSMIEPFRNPQWLYDIRDVFLNAFNAVKDGIQKGLDTIAGAFGELKDAITGAVRSVVGALKGLGSDMVGFVEDIGVGIKETAEGAIGSVIDTASSVGTTIAETATDAVETVGDTLGDAASSAIGAIVDTAESVAETVSDAAVTAGNKIADGVTSAVDEVVDIAESAVDGVVDVANKVASEAESIFEKLRGFAEDMVAFFKKIGKKVAKAMEDAVGEVSDFFGDLPQNILKGLEFIKDKFLEGINFLLGPVFKVIMSIGLGIMVLVVVLPLVRAIIKIVRLAIRLKRA